MWQDVALLTDGRFSGGSHGFCVGHICPEAQVHFSFPLPSFIFNLRLQFFVVTIVKFFFTLIVTYTNMGSFTYKNVDEFKRVVWVIPYFVE